jgi:hypothetical protein
MTGQRLTAEREQAIRDVVLGQTVRLDFATIAAAELLAELVAVRADSFGFDISRPYRRTSDHD